MTINYNQTGNSVNVTLSGELDTLAAQNIQPIVSEIIALNPKDINIECGELTYIASSGLRLFLSMRKATRANNGQTNLMNVTPAVLTVFHVTGFDRIFNI